MFKSRHGRSMSCATLHGSRAETACAPAVENEADATASAEPQTQCRTTARKSQWLARMLKSRRPMLKKAGYKEEEKKSTSFRALPLGEANVSGWLPRFFSEPKLAL